MRKTRPKRARSASKGDTAASAFALRLAGFPGLRPRKDALLVAHLGHDPEDRAFWAAQTPQARLRAVELMRWIKYGPAVRGRLQKVLEIVRPKKTSAAK